MLALRKSDLVAVRLPPGEAWLPLLDEAWDAGAAVLPIDDRLPDGEVERLVARARPTVWLDAAGTRRLDGVPADEGVALVVATSGSSAEPRAVELDHAAIDAAVSASLARLDATGDDPWLCCLPVAHMAGMLVLLRARRAGARVRILDRFDVAAFASADARYASAVPTMLVRLAHAGVSLDGFRAVLVGGGPLAPGLATPPVVETYGMTESCGGVIYDGIPLDGVAMRVGADGEIQLRGPTTMRGYRLDAEATAAAFTADGWLRTRDAGEIVDGRLRVNGRIDAAIVSGGEKVWPDEVEAVLRAHPGVADVAVAGVADPEWGARVVAYVVPADAAAPPTLPALRAHVAERLAGYKAPRELVLVDAIPRTSLGKVKRHELRAWTR